MKFLYNPLSAEPLITAPADDNITFDLPSKHIYVKGVDFVGTDTTYNVFKKPTSSSDSGEVGLVPVPTYTTTAIRYLREDGTWVTPPNTNYYRPIKVDDTSILGNNNTALNLVAGNNILLTPEMSGSSYTGKVTIAVPSLNATDDDVVILTPQNDNFGYDVRHAEKGPESGYTSGNTTTSISGYSASKTILIPQIKVDKYGHVTEAYDETITITMPSEQSLSNYKVKQTAVSSPTASGTATAFIDSISQNENGEIVVTKKNIVAQDLGLTNAMIYIGKTSTALSDGATTNPITINSENVTAKQGNVVIDSSNKKEYIWNGSNWEEFGNEGNYKVVQSVVNDPTASGESLTFISNIAQDTNGNITTLNKKTVTLASNTSAGIVPKVETAAGTIDSQTSDLVLSWDGSSVNWYKLPTTAFSDENTTYGAGTGLTLNGTTFNHTNAITAKTAFASTATSASANGGKITLRDFKYDSEGHITETTDRTITLSEQYKGTVTSVGMTVPTGLSVSPTSINSSGTFDITYAEGYSIPTNAKQANWDTAYSWGNHADAGYTSNTGTVTSVGLSMPTSVFSITNSPVTTNGTLTASFVTQSPNSIFAGPASGTSKAAPTFRAMVLADHYAPTGGTALTSSANVTSGSFTAITSLTKDSKGHVTAAELKTVTLPSFTDTWRTINVKNSAGTSLGSLGTGINTGALTLKEGTNVTLGYNSGVVTISATDTEYDNGTGLSLTGTTFSLKTTTTEEIGGIKAAAVRTSAITTTQGGTTSGRYYGVEIDSNGKAFVNVPWSNENDNYLTSGDLANYITGSGTSGYLAKFNGSKSITNGPALSSTGTRYLKEDGTWGNPVGTTYNVVSTTANGLAPKLITSNTSTITSNYYILASTNGTATPSWYKLPSSVFESGGSTVSVSQTLTTGTEIGSITVDGTATKLYCTPDTWRTIQVNGTSIGDNTLNLKAGSLVILSNSNGTVTISSYDEKVQQQATIVNAARPLLLGASTTETVTSVVSYDSNVTLNPSTNFLAIPSGTVNTSILQLESDEYLHTIQGDSDGMLIIEGSEGIILDNAVTCNYSITLTAGLHALSTATSSTYSLGTSGQVLTSNGSDVYWSTLNYVTASDLTAYAKKTDLSGFITASALEYYATTSYVDQAVAGITGGTVVSWGTTSNNTSPLTVAGTSKTVSLSGHTHNYAPISHASSATTYGVATTANYGHVKISNGDCNTVASANGLAAGMNHTHGNYATTTALASYLPLAGGNLTGAVTSSSTITATAFYQDSDRNLKDNIQLLQQDILDKIYNTNEVTFTWKNTGERAYGYIAQDMLSISEDLVRVADDGHLVLDYNSVLVLQVAALKQKIENLEERIQSLERSLN